MKEKEPKLIEGNLENMFDEPVKKPEPHHNFLLEKIIHSQIVYEARKHVIKKVEGK